MYVSAKRKIWNIVFRLLFIDISYYSLFIYITSANTRDMYLKENQEFIEKTKKSSSMSNKMKQNS